MLASLAKQLSLFPDAPSVAGRTQAPATPVVAAPPMRADAKPRRIQLGERTVEYAFRRGRRRTIGLTVTSEGVAVAAPRWVSIAEVESMIREREQWIFEKLADLQRQHAATPIVRWEDGGTLPYRGETITMRLSTKTRGTTLDRETMTLNVALPPDATRRQWKDRVEAWLQSEARAVFRDRLAVYEARLGVSHRVLRLSSAKTRWGSCSADGHILLNWRLIHFPMSSIDYVVAHELSHLKEMNHGPRFWSTVASVLPDFETAREEIRHPRPEFLPTL